MEKQGHILICDDEEGIRESYNLILGEKFNLGFARNAEEAVRYVKEHLADNPVQLVFLDIKMPKLDGIEALKEIKAMDKKVEVIMVTGYRTVETAAAATKYGAFDYLTKPFETKDVQRIAEQVVFRYPFLDKINKLKN